MKLDDVSASGSFSTNLFNSFFASILSPKQPYKLSTHNRTLLMLKNIVSSTRAFEKLLHGCDDSNAIGLDNLPSFILHQCSFQLAATVQEVFVRNIDSTTWPI